MSHPTQGSAADFGVTIWEARTHLDFGTRMNRRLASGTALRANILDIARGVGLLLDANTGVKTSTYRNMRYVAEQDRPGDPRLVYEVHNADGLETAAWLVVAFGKALGDELFTREYKLANVPMGEIVVGVRDPEVSEADIKAYLERGNKGR